MPCQDCCWSWGPQVQESRSLQQLDHWLATSRVLISLEAAFLFTAVQFYLLGMQHLSRSLSRLETQDLGIACLFTGSLSGGHYVYNLHLQVSHHDITFILKITRKWTTESADRHQNPNGLWIENSSVTCWFQWLITVIWKVRIWLHIPSLETSRGTTR